MHTDTASHSQANSRLAMPLPLHSWVGADVPRLPLCDGIVCIIMLRTCLSRSISSSPDTVCKDPDNVLYC